MKTLLHSSQNICPKTQASPFFIVTFSPVSSWKPQSSNPKIQRIQKHRLVNNLLCDFLGGALTSTHQTKESDLSRRIFGLFTHTFSENFQHHPQNILLITEFPRRNLHHEKIYFRKILSQPNETPAEVTQTKYTQIPLTKDYLEDLSLDFRL